MEGSEYLLNFTQAGLVLISLLSLIFYFQEKKVENTPQERQSVIFIYFHSLGLIFLPLLPFPLFYSSCLSSNTWQISNYALALYVFLSGSLAIYRAFKTPPRKLVHLIIFHIIPSFTLGSFLLIYIESKSLYFATLLWLLFTSIFQFSVAIVAFIHPPKGKQ